MATSASDILELVIDLIATKAAEKVLAAQGQAPANDAAQREAAPGKLLTADRLAARIGVSSDTIRRWSRGDIPKVNIAAPGKEACWRYDLAAVQRWLSARGEG